MFKVRKHQLSGQGIQILNCEQYAAVIRTDAVPRAML
jgi:hypothetical protein